MANRANFGAPSEGNFGGKYRNFNLEQGSNHYRIGPAFGSLAASGKWFSFIKQHYGYRSAPTEENPKGFVRTFICPEEKDRRTGMISMPCAECALIEATTNEIEVKTDRMRMDGKTDEQIEAVLGVKKEWLKAHNLSKRYIVLAKNEDNEWGVLWLPYKAKEALDNRRKKIKAEEGVDILSIEDGAWIDFTREGEGFRNTVYGCDVVYDFVAVEGSNRKAKVMKTEALTDADFDAIEGTCPDLATVGRRLSQEQIERMVESFGDPEVVDAVFSEGREASPMRKAAPAQKAPPKAAPKAESKPEPKAESKPEPKAECAPGFEEVENAERAAIAKERDAAAEEEDEEAALLAKLQAARAKKAAKEAAAKPVETPKPRQAVSDPDALSDDDFLAVYGNRK